MIEYHRGETAVSCPERGDETTMSGTERRLVSEIMMNLYEAIGVRRSVRKYRRKMITDSMRERILRYFDETLRLDDSIPVEAEILDNTAHNAPVRGLLRTEAPYLLSVWSGEKDGYAENVGYILEQVALYLECHGLGSCFLGALHPVVQDRGSKKFVMLLGFGYPEGRLTRESLRAKRFPLRKLCLFRNDPPDPVRKVLLAARLAPSALNFQPWRFVVNGSCVHILEENNLETKLVGKSMTEVGMGIMLAHMMIAADEMWLSMDMKKDEAAALRLDLRGLKMKNLRYVRTVLFRQEEEKTLEEKNPEEMPAEEKLPEEKDPEKQPAEKNADM
ncbi:Putative TM nitroreductase [[Clostridium] aminophilum]|uniref:Putative TM nitroreductase n=3 Tax=[Clostridium] aminophilum TaxID=1526 RepID=A0A1I0HUP6_9FIRM|nr:Putative TM nitroreductase [[Clostridium] aminophilum]